MSDYYCPNCNADLEDQPGFDPDGGCWTCTECGELLLNPNDDSGERFGAVGWYCDNCGAFLNEQSGFSDWYSVWICTECGYSNEISEDQIYNSEEEYQASKKTNTYSNEDEENTDDEDYEDYGFDEEEAEEEIEQPSYRHVDSSSDRNKGYTSNYQGTYESRPNNEGRNYQKKAPLWKKILRKKTPIGISSEQCKQSQYINVVTFLQAKGFDNIQLIPVEDLSINEKFKEGLVASVSVNDIVMFNELTAFPYSSKIKIIYHTLKCAMPPFSSKGAKNKNIDKVSDAFRNKGFVNIECIEIYDLKGLFAKEGIIEKITIEGRNDFKKNQKVRIDSDIKIYYHVKKRKKRR